MVSEKMKSRTKQTQKNVLIGFLYKFVMLFLAFFSRKLFLQYIGVEFLGINSLFSNIFNILCLADLGMGVAMTYSLYEPLSRDDRPKISALIRYYRKIYLMIAGAVLTLGLCLLPFIGTIVRTDRVVEGLHLYYILFLLKTVSSYLFVYKTTILIADQRNYLNSLVSMVTSIVQLALQLAVIVLLKNYYIFISVEILITVVTNTIRSRIADKLYPYLKSQHLLPGEDRKKLRQNIGSVFLYKLSGVLINSTDNILISMLVGTVALGYYANYNTIISHLTPFITILFSSITASVGNLIVSSDDKKRYEVFQVSTMVSNYLGILISVGFLTLAQDFIALWLGKEFIMDYAIVLSIAANFFYSCINQPIWTYREASGLYIKIKYIMLFTAVTNVILSIIGGKMYGIAGIVAATFLSKLLLCFWYEPNLLYKEYFHKKPTAFYGMCVKQLFLLAICISIAYIITPLFPAQSWHAWLEKGICISTAATLVFVLANRKSEAFGLVLQYLKRAIGKRMPAKKV